MKKFVVSCMEIALGMAIIGLLYSVCQAISEGKLSNITMRLGGIFVGILVGTFLYMRVVSPLLCKLKKRFNKKK